MRDETGKVKFDPKLGPFFSLHEGIPNTYFYWRTVWQTDREMYPWLKKQIYEDRSLAGLYAICFLPLPLVIGLGMLVSVRMDLTLNREYEAGSLLRGMRMLKPWEYEREEKTLTQVLESGQATWQETGIGVPVCSQ